MSLSVLFFVVIWMAINLVAFAMMALDKSAAQNAVRRIPEFNLLFVALIGGSLGAILGQQIFSHKMRKEPFRSILFGIVALHVAIVSYFVLKQLL